MDRGVPAGSHKGPLQKMELPALARFFTFPLHTNSTAGINVQDADLTNSIKTLLIHWDPYKTSKNEGFCMVAGGPRQHGCRAGHAHERRAGRVSPCRLEGNGKKRELQALARFFHVSWRIRFTVSQLTQFCTVGPGGWQVAPETCKNDWTFDVKTDQTAPDM